MLGWTGLLFLLPLLFFWECPAYGGRQGWSHLPQPFFARGPVLF